MKKNLFFKFFVLVAMALFTITACQNEEVAVNVEQTGEPSQVGFVTLLKSAKTNLNDGLDVFVKNVSTELQADIKAYEASSTKDVALQKSIIQKDLAIRLAQKFVSYQNEKFDNILTEISPTMTRSATINAPSFTCSYEALTELSGSNDLIFLPVPTGISLEWTDTAIPLPYLSIEWEDYGFISNTYTDKLNDFLASYKSCQAQNDNNITTLYNNIISLNGEVEAQMALIEAIQDVLETHGETLAQLEEIKANKIPIEGGYKDLIDVYNELIAITDALDERLTQAEADILDLQERVTYIEEVEIPAIWEAISFLYNFIGDVYDNFDHRVTGLTFKPDYDFGPGLSSLILVRGLSEWESKTVTGGFGWQQKTPGSVYKGITWLTYNVSPANAEIDFETLELIYSTTKLITRSTQDPLLEIVRVPGDINYQISFENGVLRVPIRIHQDAYPLLQTSFDPDAKENIKVALKLKNKGYTAGDEPTRPEKEEEEGPVVVFANGNGDEEDRSIVSSEYVTVWLGLFDGSIAEKEGFNPSNPVLYPTEIITADFLKKDCSNTDYPAVTLWVGDGKPNTVTVADSVLAVFNNLFEKEYSLPASYLFTEHTLSYELVNLGNNANGLVTFTATNGKIDVSQSNRAAATGKTLAVLVKANVNGKVHALGYVRVIIAGPEKELINITPDLSLTSPVTINCSAPVEFTVRNTVSQFINANILNKTAVNQKTNITTAAVFYQKYTGDIEINSVTVTNSTAQLPDLTQEQLKAFVAFNYVTSGNPYYIRGTVSNEAPMGDYTVVTTLKSNEYIPDLQVTWKFSVRVPQLRPSALLVNNQYMITLPAPSPNITASYTGTLNNAFLQQNGKFNYNYLNPSSAACPGFITPYFIFNKVPAGYTISDNGTTVLKDGVAAAIIEEENGEFTVSLIEGAAAYGLVGSGELKVEAKGIINEGKYVTYPAFNIYFKPPLSLEFPTSASFRNNQYSFNLYAVGYSGADVIRAWDGLTVPMKNNKEHAKLMIDYYGINYLFDQSYEYAGRRLGSPMKLDLENITYASGSSNSFNSQLSDLGPTVTVLQFTANDVEQYYNITTTPIRYKLRFNANGASLPGNLRISIPVVMEHRWGYTVENLVIRVN